MKRNSINLKYYVNLVPGHQAFKSEIKLAKKKDYCNRTEFAVDNGYKITVNGSIFGINQVTAEPAKQNSWPEIIISCLFVAALLYFLPEEDYSFSKTRWGIGLFLALTFGFFAGQVRIGRQSEMAKKFNKS